MCENHKNKKYSLIHTKGFQDLMAYLDMENLVEKAVGVSDKQVSAMIDWQILEEERLEAKILIELDNQKQASLKAYDEVFTPLYKKELESQKSLNFLASVDLEPRLKYKQVGQFRFKRYTIPTTCKEWMEKQADPLGHAVNVVSHVNPDPFKEMLDDSTFRAYYGGGQSTFTILNIPISFNLLDKNAEQRLKNEIIQLTTQVSQQITSQIQFELLEGIRNLESIPELRNRILTVWDAPIEVNVAPKIVDGKVVRAGYSYNLSAEQWATTVARTEVAQAFNWGRLDAYKQTGVVKKVEYAVTPDERLCQICAPLEGEVYKIEEAYTIIPQHANCRCTWIPIIDYSGEQPVNTAMTNNVTDSYIDAGLLPAV